ncbi:MAG: hypothetical protein ACLFUS_04390 [Candidatus Sumerlaeia bacterium]
MKDFYRSPQVEEGVHNIILQNRCGNRLTLLCHEDETELEFVYKPNAFRRKDFRARNFSNRDNFTLCFDRVWWPDIKAGDYAAFHYDPFHTRLEIKSDSEAKNTIHIINIADENCFAIAARQPLLIAISWPVFMGVSDGIIIDDEEDRGETFHRFISFPGFDENRYRKKGNDIHVIQLLENDVAIFGAEETQSQAMRVVKKFKGMSLKELIAYNEERIALPLARGKIKYSDPQWQQVADLNQRVVWSGLDAGGACFGAINRIYHLIWVRDGSMTANHMALAGNPECSRIWAPFLLDNPSWTRRDDGTSFPEFTQMVGTRWGKAEDDGLFYAAWTAYTYFRTTGDDSLIQGPQMPLLLECVDRHLEKCWDDELGLVTSDTLGEESLPSSPYYGYDIVNGQRTMHRHSAKTKGKTIERCASLYHQVNTYNVLCMIRCLLSQRPDLDGTRSKRYGAIADRLAKNLREKFSNDEGEMYSLYLTYADGSDEWRLFGPNVDFWEHAWAVSQGPFFPVPDLQLASAKLVTDKWLKVTQGYGYCPWNTLARTLFEHGLSSGDYADMLKDEIGEALTHTRKYPMYGALTEYWGKPESWRGLPFSAGSFMVTTASQLLQSLAMGLAVRGGKNVNEIAGFQYRLSRIDVHAEGEDDGVREYRLNGEAIQCSLQLPESKLHAGKNVLKIKRGPAKLPCRILGSDAELIDICEEANSFHARFRSPIGMQIKIENIEAASAISATESSGKSVEFTQCMIDGTGIGVLQFARGGEILLNVEWDG